MLVYVFQLLPSHSKNRHTLIPKTVLGLTDPLTFSIFTPPATAMVCALKEWLNTDEAYKLSQYWIDQLKSLGTSSGLLNDFCQKIDEFQREQCQDWDDLTSPLVETNKQIRRSRF